jgi:hypothetical protein
LRDLAVRPHHLETVLEPLYSPASELFSEITVSSKPTTHDIGTAQAVQIVSLTDRPKATHATARITSSETRDNSEIRSKRIANKRKSSSSIISSSDLRRHSILSLSSSEEDDHSTIDNKKQPESALGTHNEDSNESSSESTPAWTTGYFGAREFKNANDKGRRPSHASVPRRTNSESESSSLDSFDLQVVQSVKVEPSSQKTHVPQVVVADTKTSNASSLTIDMDSSLKPGGSHSSLIEYSSLEQGHLRNDRPLSDQKVAPAASASASPLMLSPNGSDMNLSRSSGRVMMLTKEEMAIIRDLRQKKAATNPSDIPPPSQPLPTPPISDTANEADPFSFNSYSIEEASKSPAVIIDHECDPISTFEIHIDETQGKWTDHAEKTSTASTEQVEAASNSTPSSPSSVITTRNIDSSPVSNTPSRLREPSWMLPELNFGNSPGKSNDRSFRLTLNLAARESLATIDLDGLPLLKSKPVSPRSWSNSGCPTLEPSLPSPPTTRNSPLTPTISPRLSKSYRLGSRSSFSDLTTAESARTNFRHSRRRTASSDCLFLSDDSENEEQHEEVRYVAGKGGWQKELWSGIDELDLVG